MTTLRFDSLPSMARYYPALARPRRVPSSPVLPDIEAIIESQVTYSATMSHYRAVCGLPPAATIPITWPQVLAGPLHAAMLAHPSFPFPSMGLVHVRNTIRRHYEVMENVPLTLRTWLSDLTPVKTGYEFAINTTAHFQDRLLWESATVALARAKHNHTVDANRPPLPEPLPERVVLRLPENLGRQYSSISRDINPIHIHRLTSMPFGFPRPIIHGMWTFARAIGELGNSLPVGECTATVSFVRPIPLPGSIRIGMAESGDVRSWDVVDPASMRILAFGDVRPGVS
jgi:acyl dehydratase